MSNVLNWVILKVSQACNLNCDYCYVYNRGDDSWKYRPKIVDQSVVSQLSKKIVSHCKKYDLKSFTIEFHGGEPLLIGIQRFDEIIKIIKNECSGLKIYFNLQTNGLLLNDLWVEFLVDNSIQIGISLDGPPYINDVHRVDHMGRGSTERLLKNLAYLKKNNPKYKILNPGFLSVVDPSLISGRELVNWFRENGIDSTDFLLPDGNYTNYPAKWNGAGAYKEFLISAFDEWYRINSSTFKIRKFEMLILGLFGVRVSLDSLGGDLRKMCVVESDGGISINDVTRMLGGIYSIDTLNIFENDLDEHQKFFDLEHIQKVSGKCAECKFLNACGGGYLPHRYDGKGFNNPSIYCDALFGIIEHIKKRVKLDIPKKYHLQKDEA